MANRVLAGNRSDGGYGLYVSKANSNVLTCDKKDLLFDSTQKTGGTGQVYAGGSKSTLSSAHNFVTATGSTKPSLGYIPLVIHSEDYSGEWNGFTAGGTSLDDMYQSRVDLIGTTLTTIEDYKMTNGGSPTTGRRDASDANTMGGSGGTHACTNINFVVLKIPCAYGYMTSTYFT